MMKSSTPHRRAPRRAFPRSTSVVCQPLESRLLLYGYTITDIGPGAAYDLNDNGIVVGINAGGNASYWSAATGQVAMSSAGNSTAEGVNNSNVVVGYIRGMTNHAFRTDIDNHALIAGADLIYGNAESGPYTEFHAINNAGGIVGLYNDHGVFYDGTTHDLSLVALDVADQQAAPDNLTPIAGDKTTGGGFGYDTTAGGSFVDVGPLLDADGNQYGVAQGISPNGNFVVGYSTITSSGYNVYPFLYSKADGAFILGTSANEGQAEEVNNDGVVVGYAVLNPGGSSVAFVDFGSGLQDLNQLIPANTGWTLGHAFAINASGQICGSGALNGDFHAFLLTPDTTGPAISAASATNITGTGNSAAAVYVTYTDPAQINLTSLNDTDLRIVGPNGVSAGVSVGTVTPSSNNTAAQVTYFVSPQSGDAWNTNDNGKYDIYLNDYEVYDRAGNAASRSGALASFTVNVPAPASVAGNVYKDANQDGSKNSGEANLSGVTVWLDLDGDKVIDSGEAKTTSDSSGNYKLSNLSTTGSGSATRVRAQLPAGYTQTSPANGFGYTVNLAAGATNTGKNFGLYSAATGSIAGTVYKDVNGNGTKDTGDTGISGVVLYIDANDNSAKDTGEATATTDASGNYSLTALAAGSYKIRQVLPAGYTQTTPASNAGQSVTLAAGQAATGKNFGDKPAATNTASIAGTVYKDTDGDGTKDTGETGLSGVVLYNDANNNSTKDAGELTVSTDSSGNFKFAALAAGSYKIRQVIPTGYSQTTPASNAGQSVTLAAGQAATGKNFGDKPANTNTASIAGNIYNDANGNLKKDTGESNLSGWTVYIDTDNDNVLDATELKTTTDSSGNYKFMALAAGTYKVRVVRPTGWTQTTPTNNYGQAVTVSANQTATGKNFGEKSA